MSTFQKYRAIVAHCDPAEQQRIAQLLTSTRLFQVTFVTGSGSVCVRQALRDRPDLVIADTLLKDLDGLEVLRRIKAADAGQHIKVFLLTSYAGLLRDRAVLEEADYCVAAPYEDGVLANRAIEMMRQEPENFPFHQVSEQIAFHLATLGAAPHLKGYPYARTGIQLAVYDPNVLRCRTGSNGLYAQLCRQYRESYRNVERCIRSLSDHIERTAGLTVLQDYFPQAILQHGRITNLALISTLAARVTSDLQLHQEHQVFQGY